MRVNGSDMGNRVDRIGVVVPVNDEEQLLAQCLEALLVAACHVAVPVTVIVVLDACTDRSAAVVTGFFDRGVEAIVVDEKSVGGARAAGMSELLRRHGRSGTWLATTDGDSTVPPHWLTAQLRHAKAGGRVVAGTVAVEDWEDRSDFVRARARREYRVGPHRHVHGANLSFAASAYCAAGGFGSVTCHEDVQLVDAFRANGEPIAWATDMPVVTSSRRQARAPRGFASYLADLERCESHFGTALDSAVARAI
jgi:glycosyltransferase involved in cell wall biosynthesis